MSELWQVFAETVVNERKPSPRDIETGLRRQEIRLAGAPGRFPRPFASLGRLRRSLVANLARQPRATSVIE